MAMLYQKQLDQGGIIDLSAKDSVIDETWVRETKRVEIIDNYIYFSLPVSMMYLYCDSTCYVSSLLCYLTI